MSSLPLSPPPPSLFLGRCKTILCTRWILQQRAKSQKANGQKQSLVSLFKKAAKATGKSYRAIEMNYKRNYKTPNKLHAASFVDDEDFIIIAAIVKNLAKMNGGILKSDLSDIIEDVVGKTPSRQCVHQMTKKFPEFFGVHTIKQSSVARTDRVRVTTAIEEYVNSSSEVFKEHHFPKHAVLATDQYIISKTKGKNFYISQCLLSQFFIR